MKYISELKPAAGQPRQYTKVMTNAMLRRSSQPTQGNQPSGFVRPQAGNVQTFQRSYERYLALARAEALTGDRIVQRITSSTPNTIFGQCARIKIKEAKQQCVVSAG
jgi:hypothetical protein